MEKLIPQKVEKKQESKEKLGDALTSKLVYASRIVALPFFGNFMYPWTHAPVLLAQLKNNNHARYSPDPQLQGHVLSIGSIGWSIGTT
jgi:hypothetical protein